MSETTTASSGSAFSICVDQLALLLEAVRRHLGLPARERRARLAGAVARAGRRRALQQRVAEQPDVGDHALGHRVVAADPRGVEVDLHHRRGEADGPVAGVLLREPRAQGDADVGVLDQPANRRLLLGRARVQRMPGRHHALAVEAGHDGRVQRLGQRDHPVGGQPRAAAGEHQRRAGAVEQRAHAGDGGRIGRRRRQPA